jgi:hypothetical protein
VPFKLDKEKACDHVNWIFFLLYMQRRCGFGEILCDWIAHCIFLMRLFVLVNDTPNVFLFFIFLKK